MQMYNHGEHFQMTKFTAGKNAEQTQQRIKNMKNMSGPSMSAYP